MYSYYNGHQHDSWSDEDNKDGCQCCGWCVTVWLSLFIVTCLIAGAVLTGVGYTNTNLLDDFYNGHRISGVVLLGVGFVVLVLSILLCFCVVKPSCCFEPVPIRVVHPDPRMYNKQPIKSHYNWDTRSAHPTARPPPRHSPRVPSRPQTMPINNVDYEYDIISGQQSLPSEVIHNIQTGGYHRYGTRLTSHSGYSIGAGSSPRSAAGIHIY